MIGILIALVSFAILAVLGLLMWKRYLDYENDDRLGYKIVWGWKVYDYTDEVKSYLEGESPYKNKRGPQAENYYTTPDDPIMQNVAKMLSKDIEGFSDLDKANFILKFVQKSIVYTEDIDNYGEDEFYVLPVNTLKRKKGDCEDIAFLYTCLCNMCGLRTMNVKTPGHMTAGVDVVCSKKVWKWKWEGITYCHAEATSQKLIGELYTTFASSAYIFPDTNEAGMESFKSQLTDYEFRSDSTWTPGRRLQSI